jgi:hypothetical protein
MMRKGKRRNEVMPYTADTEDWIRVKQIAMGVIQIWNDYKDGRNDAPGSDDYLYALIVSALINEVEQKVVDTSISSRAASRMITRCKLRSSLSRKYMLNTLARAAPRCG